MDTNMTDSAGVLDRIKGALAGMVLGDAFGMPGELWPREKIRARFGDISTFLDGMPDNETSCYFKAGQYTDDSAQALVILRALLEAGQVPPTRVLAQRLLDFIVSINGFAINYLGPSSKAALLAWQEGRSPEKITDQALTNGSAMRIAPLGCLFAVEDYRDPAAAAALARLTARVSAVTHSSDVTIAGAAMIAAAVAGFVSGWGPRETADFVMLTHDEALQLGAPTFAASLKARFALALNELTLLPTEEELSLWIYEVIGTGTMISESVPAALAAGFFAPTPAAAAHLCANLGGDTDTIGAMACAIAGARRGIRAFAPETLHTLQQVNNLDFDTLGAEVFAARPAFSKVG